MSGTQAEQYADLAAQARGLVGGERDRIANAANLSALVYHALPDLNWVGFYFYDGNELVVGPFQGQPACVRIALGRGVCGTAATTRQTQRVADVDVFPGHIPCDSASRSACLRSPTPSSACGSHGSRSTRSSLDSVTLSSQRPARPVALWPKIKAEIRPI